MTHTPICYISGALPLPQNCTITRQAGDIIIAADGGYPHLDKLSIVPDFIVGDFDSADTPTGRPNVTKLPVEKDDTDMGYAIGVGRQKNYTNFVLLGGLGGLLDHTVANLQHLHALSGQHCNAILVGNHQCATVVTDGALTLSGTPGARCSIFAWGGGASGVTLKNLYYQIENAPLSPHFPLGVSNSFADAPAQISVEQGSLLIIWETDPVQAIPHFFHEKEL